MNKTTLNIKMHYNKMGKAEKRIADCIFDNPEKVVSLSIVELAEECGCSEATIVRFSKRIGVSGYQELKLKLASEGKTLPINSSIKTEDSAFVVYEKLCNDIYLSLEKTKKVLEPDNLEAACEKIINAKRIVLFGLGNSASVAMDASHKLLRAGLNAIAYNDNHMQVIAASHLTENDVVIAVSHSGASKDIIDALKISKQKKATTISITGRKKSPLLKYTDIPLITSADETEYSILALNSRIVQLAIIDVMYHYILLRQSDMARESIEETERALLLKKS